MAEQRLFAAFYLSLAKRPTPADLPELAHRAGIEVARIPEWGPPGVSPVLGRWGGLDCEASLLRLSYYEVLLVTFRQDEFRARWTGNRDNTFPAGARVIADAFTATCRSLSPIAALLTSYAWIEPTAYLAELEERVIGGDVPSLAREHVWLLYVTSQDIDLLSAHLPEATSDLVPIPGGAVLTLKLNWEDW